MKKKALNIFILFTVFFPVISIHAIEKVSCGNVTAIPAKIPELTNFIMTLVEVLVPIILVIMGSIDLIKGISSQKEDEIKKGQQILIKRIIVAVIIFIVIVAVKFLVSIVNNPVNSNNIVDCIDCFLNGKENCKKWR